MLILRYEAFANPYAFLFLRFLGILGLTGAFVAARSRVGTADALGTAALGTHDVEDAKADDKGKNER